MDLEATPQKFPLLAVTCSLALYYRLVILQNFTVYHNSTKKKARKNISYNNQF